MNDNYPDPEKPILSVKVDECIEFEAILEPVPGQPTLPPPRGPNEPILTVQVDHCIEFNDEANPGPSASE